MQLPDINYRFIDKIHPARVALAGLIFYFLVFLVTPAHVSVKLHLEPILYVVLGYLFYWAGTYTIHFKAAYFREDVASPSRKTDFLFYITFLLAVLGVALRLYDRLIVRGVSFEANLWENREALEQQGAGMLSFLGSLLFPLVYFNYFWVLNRHKKSKLVRLICLAMFFYPTLDGVLIGSRSSILHNLAMLYLILKLTNNLRITWKRLILFSALGFAMLAIILNLFEQRLAFGAEEFDFDFTNVVHVSAYNYTFQVNKWYAEWIDKGSQTFQLLKVLMVQTGQYIVHGLLEFDVLYTNYNLRDAHMWGLQHFALYFRVLPLVDVTAALQADLFFRPGVFTSFFGDVFVDFGWFGLLFMYCWGLFCKFFWIKVKSGKYIFAPLYLFLCYIVFLMPMSNLITGAFGFIIIHSLSISVFLYYLICIIKKTIFVRQELALKPD